MVRAAASMEHVEASEKEWLGELIWGRLRGSKMTGRPWIWALGRLAARVPFHGSAHQVVPPKVAERWIERLLETPGLETQAFALVLAARRTGDRSRDVDEQTRVKATAWLERIQASPEWIAMIHDVAEMKAGDEARAFGESLPIGLELARSAPAPS